MRRFSQPNRLKRCRSLCSTIYRRRGEAVGAMRDPDPTQEACEVTFDPDVSATQRALVLTQTDLFCRMCGVASGDIDDLTGSRAKFHIGLLMDSANAMKGGLSNLQTLCSTCLEGAKNITTIKPPAIWLLSQIRRAGQEEQRAVLDWLLKKFKE